MAIWDDVLTDQDRVVYEGAGWGKPAGYGKRPALLIVDVIYNFVGDKPEPILSRSRVALQLREVGWGVHALQRLIAKARQKHIPCSTRPGNDGPICSTTVLGTARTTGWTTPSMCRAQGQPDRRRRRASPEDIAFVKKKPSAFFGTPWSGT
jgi:hypothetical protein